MAIFECTGGVAASGNALPGDVKAGKTFSNNDDIDLVGTFEAQTKTVTSSRADQEVTPDEGKYLDKVVVNGLAPTGTFTPTSRGANIDMGEDSNYRYVTTENVPNNNTGTYTYESGDSGGTKDLGETNTYRYVNAGNVYAAGRQDPLSYYMEATLRVRSMNRVGNADVTNIILKIDGVQVANWSIGAQTDTKNTGEWVTKKGTKSGTYTRTPPAT